MAASSTIFFVAWASRRAACFELAGAALGGEELLFDPRELAPRAREPLQFALEARELCLLLLAGAGLLVQEAPGLLRGVGALGQRLLGVFTLHARGRCQLFAMLQLQRGIGELDPMPLGVFFTRVALAQGPGPRGKEARGRKE